MRTFLMALAVFLFSNPLYAQLNADFAIYNRWGEPMFERSNFLLSDRNAAWDGKYKGMPVPQGTYVYIANLTSNESNYIQKGVITVVY